MREGSGVALFWSLFIVFVLGPCEWLIPASIDAAARFGTAGLWLVVAVFSGATMLTMSAAVLVASESLERLSVVRVRRRATVFAGLAIAVSGGLVFLGA